MGLKLCQVDHNIGVDSIARKVDLPERLTDINLDGVLKGFKEAEEFWGGRLPDISYETIERALSEIDQRIEALGGQIVSYRV